MRIERYGWYCDVTLEGDYCFLVRDSHIIVNEFSIPLPGENVLFLVCYRYNGQVLLAGQGHGSGKCWLYKDGKWNDLDSTFGTYPCVFYSDKLYFVNANNQYRVHDLNSGDTTYPINRQIGVNGIRYIDYVQSPDGIVTGDQTYGPSPYNLSQWCLREYIIVGQSYTDGAIGQYDKNYKVEPGNCKFLRFYKRGNNLAIAIVKELEGKVVFYWITEEELKSFPVVSDEKITPINRAHWLAFFAGDKDSTGGWQTDIDPRTLPGNSFLLIPDDIIFDKDYNRIGEFITGATVEEIESKANISQYLPVVYWDARDWPYYPTIDRDYWLCIQAYCGVNESPDHFENDLRDILNNLTNRKVALVAQCYTSNSSLTKYLKTLVPIFSRLVHDYGNIIATLPFSGSGRATGLQDHPEVRPLWEEYAASITGEPAMADLKIPQKVRDNINALYELHKDLSEGTDDQRRELMKLICEQNRYDLGFKHGWKSADPNRPPSKDAIGYSETGDDSAGVYIADVFSGVTRAPSIPENYDFSNQHFIPVNPVNHLGSSMGNIVILAYDSITSRSNPNGCLIRFEVESPNPVTEAEFDLEGDGEPSIKIMFSQEVARDGRYVRAFAFKFTVNGKWVLRVTAKDNQGNTYQSNGQQVIEVIP